MLKTQTEPNYIGEAKHHHSIKTPTLEENKELLTEWGHHWPLMDTIAILCTNLEKLNVQPTMEIDTDPIQDSIRLNYLNFISPKQAVSFIFLGEQGIRLIEEGIDYDEQTALTALDNFDDIIEYVNSTIIMKDSVC